MCARKRDDDGDFEVDLGGGSKEVAVSVVKLAMAMGATAAEAVVRQGDEFSTVVRLGVVETLKQGWSRSFGVRVINGTRSASTYCSDFTERSIRRTVQAAVELSRITSEDSYEGLPEASQLGCISGDLDLHHSDVYSMPIRERIDYARRAERSALDADQRVTKSDGGSFDAASGCKAIANSLGFAGESRRSYCSIASVPVVDSGNGLMQRDYWFSVARSVTRLESPEHVGRVAAQRALLRLGARRVKTSRVPVVFDSQAASSLLQDISQCVNGDSACQNASFLARRLGEKIADSNVTIVDDGTIPGGFGTSPFDSEGVRTRRTRIIERGILTSYLLNTYTARKLGLQTTGNASRGLAGKSSVAPTNFFLQPGDKTCIEIVSAIKEGLYVTELLGDTTNIATGDFSRGVTGLWIVGGELAFPVEGIVIIGNLKQMLLNISEVGRDLDFRGSVASPAIRIDGLIVSGES